MYSSHSPAHKLTSVIKTYQKLLVFEACFEFLTRGYSPPRTWGLKTRAELENESKTIGTDMGYHDVPSLSFSFFEMIECHPHIAMREAFLTKPCHTVDWRTAQFKWDVF